ncbi:MAG: WXG100 family type VII secretion target [Clostridia bacterium]|nr:WXG100 family type VII secretion target [Clostridia bacterium]
MLEVLVDMAQLSSAANNMQNALETYRGAIDNVKTAADNLASKWEGDGQVAFVNDQQQAYTWYNSLVQCVHEMIAEARRTVERYRDHVAQLKSQM